MRCWKETMPIWFGKILSILIWCSSNQVHIAFIMLHYLTGGLIKLFAAQQCCVLIMQPQFRTIEHRWMHCILFHKKQNWTTGSIYTHTTTTCMTNINEILRGGKQALSWLPPLIIKSTIPTDVSNLFFARKKYIHY